MKELKEFSIKGNLSDSIGKYYDEFEKNLLEYAFECFKNKEHIVATKEYTRFDNIGQNIEAVVKMSKVDKEDIDLLKSDGWRIYDFSNYTAQTWINSGVVKKNEVDDFLKWCYDNKLI